MNHHTISSAIYAEQPESQQHQFVAGVSKIAFGCWPAPYTLAQRREYFASLLDKNPHSIGLLQSDVMTSKSEMEPLAYVSILPITSTVYTNMLDGRLSEYDLDRDLIISKDELLSMKDRFFYFQTIAKAPKIRYSSPKLIERFPAIERVNAVYKELILKTMRSVGLSLACQRVTILAEAASTEGEKLMVSYGFKHSGHTSAPFGDTVPGGNRLWTWSWQKNAKVRDDMARIIEIAQRY